MLTNKQLSELIKKELSFLAAEVFCFSGWTMGSTPDSYRKMRCNIVQVRTDRLYWLAEKFPLEYQRFTWELAQLRPSRPEAGPAIDKTRRYTN